MSLICYDKKGLPHTTAGRCDDTVANARIQTDALFRRTGYIEQRPILLITQLIVIFITNQ